VNWDATLGVAGDNDGHAGAGDQHGRGTRAHPTSPAITEGNPKMPLPRMLLTASATMLQRPIARTSSGCEVARRLQRHRALVSQSKRSGAPCLTRGAPRALFVCDAPGVQCQRAKRTTSRGSTVCRQPTSLCWRRYDLDALRRTVPREEIAARPAGLWRWQRTAAGGGPCSHRESG